MIWCQGKKSECFTALRRDADTSTWYISFVLRLPMSRRSSCRKKKTSVRLAESFRVVMLCVGPGTPSGRISSFASSASMISSLFIFVFLRCVVRSIMN